MPDHQHDKHAVHREIVARLRQQIGGIRRLASGLTEEDLARRTIPEKWSLKELICHLWSVEQVFEGRVDAMLAEDEPALAGYEPDDDPVFARLVSQPAAETLDAFAAGRGRLADRLEALSPADWHRAGRHPEYPHYDVHFCAEYLSWHEAHHIYQMLQRRAPLGRLPH